VKDWFEQLNQREQLSVLVLGMVLVLYLLIMLIWSPLDEMRDDMARQNRGVAGSLKRVDAMASEVMSLRQNGNAKAPRRNLTALINRTTAEHKLEVSRLQPNSRGEIQVRLEGAAFDDLLAWFHQLEYDLSLLLREISITQSGTSGRVNATVRVGQAD
jgi:type II secretory pathway component PulM